MGKTENESHDKEPLSKVCQEMHKTGTRHFLLLCFELEWHPEVGLN